MDRYQGIVALDGESLVGAALTSSASGTDADVPALGRRAPLSGGRRRPGRHLAVARGWPDDPEPRGRRGGNPQAPRPEGTDDAELQEERAEDWQRARILAATVRTTSCSIRRFPRKDYSIVCSTRRACAPCRRHRSRPTASARGRRSRRSCAAFGAEGLADMREPDGGISVTCEFCATEVSLRAGRDRLISATSR